MLNFISKIWNKETSSVTAAALLIGFASLASRIVGLLRDRLLAGHFGAGDALDAYYAAFRLPDFFYQLIVLGALSAGFIPVFTEYLERHGHGEAWKLAEKVFTTIALILGVVCLILALFADKVVPWTVPGFSGDKLAMTISLSRILLISTFTLGLSAVMGGVLQATRRFVAFSLAPVLYNVGIIIGIIGFTPSFGVAGVAWGVVLGAGLHLLVQALVAVPMGFRRVLPPSFKDSGVRQILKLMVPRIAGLAAQQVNLIALLVLASTLESGSIAVFNLANNLQYVPIGLIGISFAVAAFPAFSKFAAQKDMEGLRQSFLTTTRKILFFIVPCTALMLLLRAQIVRLVLGAGAFDWNATIRTSDVLAIFVLSLIAQSMIPLAARVFYAMQDTRTPLYVSIVSLAANLGLAIILKGPFGIIGLAAAFTVDAFAQFLVLWYLLRRKFGHLESREVGLTLTKIVLSSIALFGFGWLARQAVGTVFQLRTFWEVLLQAVAAIVVGGGAFYLVATLLRIDEMREFVNTVKLKLYRQAKIEEGAEKASI
ncbi:MAG: murein biosynthesis integral membrane protein MurJ [Patescibacteria group bacterium]|nr:murein biosynthesis integral membrane protein MurJ [Patescibacteria group bacterium]